MPRLLSPKDVSTFRDRLCQAAERLFAEDGPSAVTMRQLAVELGCSPMTPYRYFKDKDEILAAVRAAAFLRLSEALESALESSPDRDLETLARAISRAHVAFVEEEPHAYRLMFDLMQPREEGYPVLHAASARAREVMTLRLAEAADTALDREAVARLGEAQWAAVHGALMLHLADKLAPGVDLESFVGALVQRICRRESPQGALVGSC